MNSDYSVKSEKFKYHSYFILLMHENGSKSFNREVLRKMNFNHFHSFYTF